MAKAGATEARDSVQPMQCTGHACRKPGMMVEEVMYVMRGVPGRYIYLLPAHQLLLSLTQAITLMAVPM